MEVNVVYDVSFTISHLNAVANFTLEIPKILFKKRMEQNF